MPNVFDVAKYILQKKGPMSTWKLQKLCYYAQAWSLAWNSKSLFDEDFEAWTNGPVCRELYNRHKGMFMIQESELQGGNIANISQEQLEDIDVVLDYYGDKEPYWLRNQTHAEDPWINARKRGNCTDGDPCDEVITKDEMGLYYESR